MQIKITKTFAPATYKFSEIVNNPGIYEATSHTGILFVVNSTHVIAVSEAGLTVLDERSGYHGWKDEELCFFKSKKKIRLSN